MFGNQLTRHRATPVAVRTTTITSIQTPMAVEMGFKTTCWTTRTTIVVRRGRTTTTTMVISIPRDISLDRGTWMPPTRTTIMQRAICTKPLSPRKPFGEPIVSDIASLFPSSLPPSSRPLSFIIIPTAAKTSDFKMRYVCRLFSSLDKSRFYGGGGSVESHKIQKYEMTICHFALCGSPSLSLL